MPKVFHIVLVVSFIAFEDTINGLSIHLLCHDANQPYYRKTAKHGDSSTVDGVDRITQKHVDYREPYTPDEAGPHSGCRHTTPVESEHEGSEEGSGKCSPRDAHELGDECWWVEGNHQ